MGFNLVFSSLKEVFPQVDVRVLKAVAIEHSKDVDAAVEFILLEVLPTLCTPLEAKQTFSDNQETTYPSVEAENQEVNQIVGSHQVSHALPSSVTHENTYFSDCFSDTPLAIIQELQGLSVYDSNPAAATDVFSNLCSDTISFKEESLPTNVQHFQSLFSEEKVQSIDSEIVVDEEKVESIDSGVVVEIGVGTSLNECEEPRSRSSLENGNEMMIFYSEMVDVDDEPFPTNIATRSGQIVSIDFLEEFIEDAKNNKKTLSLAMESVIGMVGEVELQEEATEQARKEASEGGLDILTKAEDLKQMLQHAKEANDMHAGEVYGERAILATEVRELQSRLINLSDARDKSLSIIDEMSRDLKSRLAVAKAEEEAAEQEKLEKEKSAREALTDQEFIMKNVVEESKKLQLEAEENAKLREFLMDRGLIVDILQGEIAVICEDVKSLKEKIDGRVPINKSPSSSQMSSILASSNMSLKSIPTDHSLERTKSYESLETNTSLKSISSTKSSENLKSTGQELLNSGRFDAVELDQKEKAIGDDHKTFSEDDWDWVEAELKTAEHQRWSEPSDRVGIPASGSMMQIN
ncbi:uncharacterized protein LOC143864333 isoform X2 [Tasmannia lanceolata]|uniref:uncharacterized protein LOC143864333 isoform X2 n=1 Tax=Tasmannia lanceolata TaxID=3420 RepID=UPI00406336A6